MSSEAKYLNNDYQNFFEKKLSESDPELFKAINDELIGQQNHIELIASENIVSQAVLEAQGSVLTNKYAEGYSGKRYYNGCEHVDVAEELAIERLKKLFNCKFANVQPHSGAQANGAVFLALLNLPLYGCFRKGNSLVEKNFPGDARQRTPRIHYEAFIEAYI